MGRKSAYAVASIKKGFAIDDDVAFNDVDGEEGDNVFAEEGEDDAPAIEFGGKKKAKGKKSGYNSGFVASAFGLLGEDDDADVESREKGYENSAFELVDGEEECGDKDGDDVGISFTGKKKKSSKGDSKKTSLGSTLLEEESDAPSNIVECGGDCKDKKEDVASKNKKKKMKGGKNLKEEEEDLDKILAELGVPLPPAQQEEAEEEGHVEAVTSKKKKKKKGKEKEKEDKAPAAEEKPEDTISKVSGKKVPKQVREMQERLAKLKEAEERKKRQEEEKLRKEEEERLRQEELDRLAEEKKRLKKEREKEKLLKKRQEGKLLTGKQKEEARRLQAMRNQILANAKLDPPTGEPARRPLYQKKKSKPQNQSNRESTDAKEIREDVVSELASVEAEMVEVTDVVDVNRVDDDEEDDDEEWDAKSWDEADLTLPGKSAFADEEVDSESEPLPKKDMPIGLDEKVMRPKLENVDVQNNSVAEKKNTEVVDDQPVRNKQNLRSPICCIMGHVDAGKTLLVDCIRGTRVQEGEAGGITQQIGATYFPAENIRERTKELKADATLNVPGLLVIDTPGHESFTKLRSRGSGLCDLAILAVDLMHGLEPQTIESLNLLKSGNTDFVIALNKVDRLYGWKTCRNAPIGKAIKQQSKDVMVEFNRRLTEIITQFKEQGLNTELYYKNKEMGETYNIVPTSAMSGEGIPDLLLLLVQWAQKTMIKRLTYSEEVQCTILEVKVDEGHGTTIDIVLVNGVLHEGDQIVVGGMHGPIVTSIRALLTPHPMTEFRVKGTYLHHKEIKAAQCIKIAAQGLEHAIPGANLYVVGPNDDIENIKNSAMAYVNSVMSRIGKSGKGVCVQASTLGSLEALLDFLETPAVNIPVSTISIGPVHKRDVKKASVMLEKKKEYGTILAFDVKVTPDAQEHADELGVKIFTADIIYHLFDQFKAYIDSFKLEKKREAAKDAVFPCVLKIMPNCVFRKKDEIILGVDVVEGIVKIGTPLCAAKLIQTGIPKREFVEIGRVASIEINHKPVDYAKKGQKVAIKIIGSNPEEQQKIFGRHFQEEDLLLSKISRHSIDVLKAYYKDELSTEDVRLLKVLKNEFEIP